MKKGDFIEEKPNKWKEGLKGRIVRPVKKDCEYVWISPINDNFLRSLALDGHPIGIRKENIIKINGKELKGE